MSGKPIVCDLRNCSSFDGVVQIFLNRRYAHLLNEYRSILEEDPEYLSYHGTSTALRLQFQLKSKEFPQLAIGTCLEGAGGECCIVRALHEAISRKRHHDAAA